MKILFTGASMLLAIAATPALAQVMSPAEYVKVAGASDLYERQSSQLVLGSTQDPKIKALAHMMIEDHGKSTAMVKAAALKSGLTPQPPKLMPLQEELIAELQAESGSARDADYLAQQRAAHGQALSVQQAYAIDGGAPSLKAAAADIVPVVEHHIDMLKGM